ncbi:hypothetical protein E308F_30740 [Moorella sp. E308F]|uniref:hypothetical protein n=1 Tax=Moorella sp. E308F TaxID=2572682 RepID=UPI0010FFAF51|nr:hypothetical protein [Moorella sp. E308F]GEA16828.1 hypothetical protein E308F_30740 [Moorella sp. E308F]
MDSLEKALEVVRKLADENEDLRAEITHLKQKIGDLIQEKKQLETEHDTVLIALLAIIEQCGGEVQITEEEIKDIGDKIEVILNPEKSSVTLKAIKDEE